MALANPPASLSSTDGKLMSESLSDRLAARLAAQIESGALQPGDRLPTEAKLALLHGVSRSVVREAVHRIKSRGLLLSRQGSGVFVAAQPLHRALEFDPAVLGSVSNLLQVLEVRRVMEGEIAALAAERATRTQITALRRALQAIDAASARGEDGVAEDLAFHLAIAEASGNPQFSQLLGFLGQYLREGMRITRANEARRADFMEAVRHEHHAVLDAIAARDAPAARRAANLHMDRGRLRLERGGVITRPVSKIPRRRPTQPTESSK
ncbi:MAG: FadR family transcriptional regulator [Ideonella sp.]|jgi:GntR family transcriptional regulator, transcriptional repressor for pyruvate dehydrogenase complex|nr:FadR family transcriptional regulator [Ideonella sp.]MBL0150032.1 FadR family transcriptional regulator [Ideonella sp.]